jgi:hypothetical protein
MLGRALQIGVTVFVCAQMVLILHFVGHGDLERPSAPLIEYKDFVSILLMALGVMIAIATIFAAIGAFWGFDLLKRETQASAEKIARERIEAMLPGLVVRAVRFEMQGQEGLAQPSVDVSADQIADEIAKNK